MQHPMITEIEKTGFPLDHQPIEYTCDGCGDVIDDDVFEYDGEVYCNVYCLTRNTDVQFGHVSEFK